jgi:hypothetical protein
MNFNYSKLFVRIKEKFGTIKSFAEVMGLSRIQMSYKLNNRSHWSQEDIVKTSTLLNILPEEVYDYFLNTNQSN